jgi:hypothetical protein
MIEARDEWLHEPGPDPAWQESFYFNWADPEARAFTLARVGYRFHAGKTDGLVISLRDGRVELYHAPADLDHEGPCSAEDPARGMRSGRFVATMEQPLRRWRLQIEGANGMDVVFEAHTPPFDYHSEAGRLATTMTGAHFEQSGRVRGWTAFAGDRHEIDALGQRDKSWGARDWARLEGWNWISGQLGPDLSFNVMQTIEAGRPLDNGFVFRDGENHAIERALLDYRWGDQEHRMQEAELVISERSGVQHRIHAEAIASFPILRDDVWLEETFVRFRLEGSEGVREGQGVVEHVWRASREEVRARASRLVELAGVFSR